MNRFWIIGAGKFGLRAAQKISQRYEPRELIIIDKKRYRVEQLSETFPHVVHADGIRYLSEHLDRHNGPDFIVPAVPAHVAYEWVKSELSHTHQFEPIPVPGELIKQLPKGIKGPSGQLYTSHADFICPEDCNEPDEICTYTKKPRPPDLFRLLEINACQNFTPVVIRSRQLLPGVGGYSAKELYAVRDHIRSLSGRAYLATACRCHGVVHAFKVFKT